MLPDWMFIQLFQTEFIHHLWNYFPNSHKILSSKLWIAISGLYKVRNHFSMARNIIHISTKRFLLYKNLTDFKFGTNEGMRMWIMMMDLFLCEFHSVGMFTPIRTAITRQIYIMTVNNKWMKLRQHQYEWFTHCIGVWSIICKVWCVSEYMPVSSTDLNKCQISKLEFMANC